MTYQSTWSYRMATNNNSLVCPVRKGERVSIYITDGAGSPGKDFVWMPVGAAPLGLVAVGDDQSVPAPPDHGSTLVERHPVDDLADVLGSAEGADAERLREALQRVLEVG